MSSPVKTFLFSCSVLCLLHVSKSTQPELTSDIGQRTLSFQVVLDVTTIKNITIADIINNKENNSLLEDIKNDIKTEFKNLLQFQQQVEDINIKNLSGSLGVDFDVILTEQLDAKNQSMLSASLVDILSDPNITVSIQGQNITIKPGSVLYEYDDITTESPISFENRLSFQVVMLVTTIRNITIADIINNQGNNLLLQDTKNDIKMELKNLFEVNQLVKDIDIRKMFVGSLVVDFDIILSKPLGAEHQSILSTDLAAILADPNITLSIQDQNVTIKPGSLVMFVMDNAGNKTKVQIDDVCFLYDLLKTCENTCIILEGKPTCPEKEKEKVEGTLNLAVLITVALLFCASLAITVVCSFKVKSNLLYEEKMRNTGNREWTVAMEKDLKESPSTEPAYSSPVLQIPSGAGPRLSSASGFGL